MSRALLLTFALAAVPSPAAAAAADEARPELELARFALGKDPAELSGIALLDGKTVLVSDGAEDHWLYELRSPRGPRFTLAKGQNLLELAGARAYQAELAQFAGAPPGDRRLDLEGLAVCGQTVYLVNERVRHVLVADAAAKTLERAPIDAGAVPRLAEGESNAGYEGVAADCAGQTLYLAKERDPRLIVKVSLKPESKWKVLGVFDVPVSDRGGQMVIQPWTGEGLFAIGPDFADLAFDGGHLYALERNTFEIAKIDPAAEKVVARVSYYKTEKGLYETGEPFGVAEALLLTKDEIVVGFDNNGAPLTGKAAKQTGVAGVRPALATFKRPAGF